MFTTFHGEATDETRSLPRWTSAGPRAATWWWAWAARSPDTAKAVAENLGLPCVIIPTVASNDAPCRAAVLYNDAGWLSRPCLMRRNPDLVLVDTGIIANAPRRPLPPAWATRCPPGLRPGPARTAAPAPWPGATCPIPG